jgi:hypothetical protein
VDVLAKLKGGKDLERLRDLLGMKKKISAEEADC